MPNTIAIKHLLHDDSDSEDLPPLRRDWEETDTGGSLVSRVSRMEAEAHSTKTFTRLFILAQLLGVLILVLLLVWLLHYQGGFAWHSDLKLQFNWHPLLMVSGMVCLSANGILIYRGFRTERKLKLKVLHAVIQLTVLVFASVGLKAVFDTHNLHKDADGKPAPFANLYSLHSWVGLSVIILFSCQWLFGLVSFLYPGLRQSLRDWYLPVHQFFGMAIFAGSVVASLLGLSEKAFFVMSDTYSSLPPQAMIMNFLGLLILLFAGLVIHLVSTPAYKRRSTDEDTSAYLE